MKNILIASAVLFAHVAFAQGEAPANDAIAPVAEAPVAQADTPAQTPAYPVSVVVDDETTTYDLSVIADAENIKGAKAYIDAYADNVQKDEAFKVHEAKALETIRAENRFFGTWWAVFPPLLAIFLALITKEVYSSLFVGIVSGALLYSGFSFELTLMHVVKDGFIGSIADAYNIGILFFLVLLGALVAMMNKTGASAAFGKWAQTHIKSRLGAQVATIILGILIFVDDYFNCLTVGSVMRPVTDAKKVSRAKLAYLIDATAAPICIIAPISSWAAAVAGFAKGAGAESGFSLFISAIPYNFYAILTIVTMFALALMKFDFGPMKRHEAATAAGEPDLGAIADATEMLAKNDRGRVIDLIIPVLVLIACCMVGMIYSGGYFGGDNAGNFVKAFSDSDASVGLALGSIVAIVFAVAFYLCRRVISFRDCMDAFSEGFKAMVPAIMILCCAWTLKTMTDSLGAKVFISDLISGPAAGLWNFLPAIIFVIAIILAFSTGTSWGTFGILIPIVLAAIPGSSMTIVAVSACMAGAVCGDHCSPISDTTIMASAGAQCNHIVHVNTQLPYALVVAAVSFVAYIVAPFIGTAWISLPLAILLMLATLFFIKLVIKGPACGADDAIAHKVKQVEN
ncbi:MAG: Na+/H+ antiporter NhaC family protein [Kiritimatiellae bacterium]|nr:Na+/H+ antiporter NhaC family protein [Kiritimatiellia bacterium]